MSRLYVFGIGGTGARVLKSLVMLLSSGIKLRNTDEVVPVLIDADQQNGDLTRTVDLLERYVEIRSHLTFNTPFSEGFFSTALGDMGMHFRVPISGDVNKTFGDFIHFNQLDESNKALMSLLFSKRNLKAEMNVGFKGNPNMGSVVLNNFSNDAASGMSLKQLLASFQADDRIFIISSIFGGTGAAGFPLLLKSLRGAVAENFQAAAFLRQCQIGAVTVLPYFGVEDREDSTVNMATFLSKAKSALTYYMNNLDVNVLYYIGDKLKNNYRNCEGGRYQENNAHFVEMAAALAVVDFAASSPQDSRAYKEYAIREDADPVSLPHLSLQTREVMQTPLMQLFLFCEFFKNKISESLTYAWARDKHLQETLFEAEPYKSLNAFFDGFLEWLHEMDENSRSFRPFDLDFAKENPLTSVVGMSPLHENFMQRHFGRDKGFFAILDAMEKVSVKMPRQMSREDYVMNVFFRATSAVIKQYF